MSGYGTRFTESEALLAILSEDPGTARRIVAEMLPGERRALTQAAEELARLCRYHPSGVRGE